MTTYFQQLEHTLNALRAHYRASKADTAELRSKLAIADAAASAASHEVGKMRDNLRAGAVVGIDELVEAHRASVRLHAQADEIRDTLEHAQDLEHEAQMNVENAAKNLIAEVEAMVLMEASKPVLDDIGPVWDSLK